MIRTSVELVLDAIEDRKGIPRDLMDEIEVTTVGPPGPYGRTLIRIKVGDAWREFTMRELIAGDP